eukprot:gnl/TRDRNA2_/TRDRNA2_39105_c1_seq1.p1 gnl/TRDRNA2_/TRDRNA2_39105_c1~~gnl/TRDRNA2_/TRDRNA2_39105_c1_seq1.p1  ORF type:complete len:110 (-),score=25.02 gnl/TRDRNA2_/TRDRNA2_39105_c1_seq1:78-407(-)
MPITPEQFVQTLENMTTAWEGLPDSERLPRDEEKSFFDDPIPTCLEIIRRWHTGESSHPDKEMLKEEYSYDEAGQMKLHQDLRAIKDDPFVQAADLKLRLVKYAAPSAD